MPEVRAALFAAHFNACHAVTGVCTSHDVFGSIGLPETRPPAAGIEFGRGIKQGIAATYAAVNSRIMAIPIRASKRLFGAALAAYLVLLRTQFFAPFGIGFCNWCSHQAVIRTHAVTRAQFPVQKLVKRIIAFLF
jgi:hypothetical protein